MVKKIMTKIRLKIFRNVILFASMFLLFNSQNNASWGECTTCNPPIFTSVEYEGTPFKSASAVYIGPAIVRSGYDLQPTVMYDNDTEPPTWRMWWLGQFDVKNPDAVDLDPLDYVVGDRIYYSQKVVGVDGDWSPPIIVLKGLGGSSGLNAADDHLVGSPSVLKKDGVFYMFYEAYGNWVSPVNRFYSYERGDTWITNGTPEIIAGTWEYPVINPDWAGGIYSPETNILNAYQYLGFVPYLKKADTHPIYSYEVVYNDGKKNRFVAAQKDIKSIPDTKSVQSLNQGEPLFYLYDSPGTGRKALYAFFDPNGRNSFLSLDSAGEGVPNVLADTMWTPDHSSNIMGYVSESLSSLDMIGSNLNRIMLAFSTDGVNWTRFHGNASGGAVLEPIDLVAQSRYFAPPHNASLSPDPIEKWDVLRYYGSGYPMALVRDDFLEIYYTDDTCLSMSNPCDPENNASCQRGNSSSWRVRLLWDDIDNAQAYINASKGRQFVGGAGTDIKWSPLHKRYFAASFYITGDINSQCFQHTPGIAWSEVNPDPLCPPSFPLDPGSPRKTTLYHLPIGPNNVTSGGWGVSGGILGNHRGETLDCGFTEGLSGCDPNTPYTAIHLFFELAPFCFFNTQTGKSEETNGSVFHRDIHQDLIFLYRDNTLSGSDIYVDHSITHSGNGTEMFPFKTVNEAVTLASKDLEHNLIIINAGNYPETDDLTMRINQQVTLSSVNGLVTIGKQ